MKDINAPTLLPTHPTPQFQVQPATSVTLKIPTFPVTLVVQLDVGVGLVGQCYGSATEMANGGLTIDLKRYQGEVWEQI